MEEKQVIIIRKDLNMRKGKIVSQGAHASMAAILHAGYIKKISPFFAKFLNFFGIKTNSQYVINMDEEMESWLSGRFKKICVYVNSEEELLAIHKKAQEAGLHCALIQDSGLTEFGGVPTYTAVAIGPNLPEKIDLITGNLSLL